MALEFSEKQIEIKETASMERLKDRCSMKKHNENILTTFFISFFHVGVPS